VALSSPVADLIARWRADAESARRLADDRGAAIAVTHANELEAALAAQGSELLTLAEAVRESGYSARRLREMVSEGVLENAGRRGSPRFRRDALPRKRTSSGAPGPEYDPVADARALVRRMSVS
jgi:hypothetical protein